MSSHHVLKLQQSVQASLAGCAAAGGWKLAAGQAVSLRTNTPGVLEIARGRVWLTLGGSFNHLPGAAVDHVLHAGERLAIAPGQQVVMEAWNPSGGGDVAAFRWEAGTAPAKAPAASAVARDWENGVVNVAGAGGRCAAGLARFVGRWITHQRQRTTCSVLP
jgi:hypothetical protein